MKKLFTNTQAIASRGPCVSTEMAYEITGGNNITIEQILDTNHLDIVQKGWFIANACELSNIELIDFAYGCVDVAVTLLDESYEILPSVRYAIIEDEWIEKAMLNASILKRPYAYAIYAACTRNPYDRVYSATAACRLLDEEYKMMEFFKEFVK